MWVKSQVKQGGGRSGRREVWKRVMQAPRVVNIRKRVKWDVYIGRRVMNGSWELEQSKWHNPFVIGRDGTRDQVLKKYRDYLVKSPLVADLLELEGKVLACWCAPDPCHGHILVEEFKARYVHFSPPSTSSPPSLPFSPNLVQKSSL